MREPKPFCRLQCQIRQNKYERRKGVIKMAEKIKVMLSEQEVDAKICELGKQISEDYAGKQVHLVCVLKGGSFFMCELAKRITVPVSLDFMSVSSYGAQTESSGGPIAEEDVEQRSDS